MPKGMGYWRDSHFPKPGGTPNPWGRGTPKPKGKEVGKAVDKIEPTVKESINMMGQLISNEQPTIAQTEENIRKGNV